MFVVRTEKLVKSYNGINAVDGLDLEVEEGSVYGFLGPNGAGKTTTIKMLTGLAVPDSGQISLFGKNILYNDKRSRLGYLPDVPGFYNWMSGAEFLEFCADMVMPGNRSNKAEIDRLLDLVGLKRDRKRIGGYSRGMKQRLGIAQALIGNPGLVFLDEPTSALDPVGRKEVLDIISQLAGKLTVFFSTHILADVERVCSRAVIINKGRVVLEGTIDMLKGMSASTHVIIETGDADEKAVLLRELGNVSWVESTEDVRQI